MQNHTTMDYDRQKIELLNVAIKRVMEENKDEDEQLLLSRLLSQVESLKEEDEEKPDEIERDEMAKEVKKVKQQNTITHCLLSAVIVLMVGWQVSEVSLILKLKGVSDGLVHPFRSIGGFVANIFKRPLSADSFAGVIPPPPPPIRIPDLPQLEMPGLRVSGQRDDE